MSKADRKQKAKPQAKSKNENINSALVAFEQRKSESGMRTPGLDESSAESAVNHIREFDIIMTSYAENARKSLQYNRRYKRIYFYGSLAVLFVIAIYTVNCLSHPYWFDTPSDYLAPIASFMTAYIVLPITISKYLFNPQETHDLNEIVKSIQKHDRIMTGHDSPELKKTDDQN